MAQGPWGGGSSGNDGGQNGGQDGNEPPRGPQRPWGQQGGDGNQRPGQPPRPSGDLPEIEQLMKKGQDRLRVLMGGRGGTGGGRPGGGGQGPAFRFDRRMLVIGGLIAVGMWTVASFYSVKPEERSVEFLFGRAIGTGDPGLNFAPWPVVTKEIVQVTGERVTEIGTGRSEPTRSSIKSISSGSSSAIAQTDSGLMLTSDQNIVDMEYQVVWNISDPEKYLFNLADPPGTIRAVAESSMRDIIARSELAPILNRDRGAIAEDLKLSVQQTLDSYQSGVNVVRVNLDRADPPSEVIDAFREVQAAQQKRDALEKQADAYANQVLAKARGDAAAEVEQAEGYRAAAINNAQGESARFNSVYAEYAKAPEVTRKRMYLETMEKVLGNVNKVIIENGDGAGVVPYLPLDQLRKTTTTNTGGSN
ncbi:MAG: FtsH protease activity modulator HflK [Paracoccus sp. (in: a-proteobacteria)]